jgi:glycosyltransferase involved in cell wall biosynthesis
MNDSGQVDMVRISSSHSTTSDVPLALRPKISIIINNFNYGRFVGAAIDSALNQTYPHVEVIVVDDGSTDGSREIVKKYESRARIILKENGGQVSAFNVGWRAATGKMIAFLDSDDSLFPQAIETVVNAWGPEIVKMQFPLQILGPRGSTEFLMPRAHLSEGNLLRQLLETGRYVSSPTSGNVYCHDFLEKIFPIPESEWDHGDAYINNSAPFYGTIGAIHEPLGFYRVHENSMSSAINRGAVDLKQLEKLMRHAYQEKSLIESLAQGRGLRCSPNLVVSHWMHLKLSLALYRLKTRPGLCRVKMLLQSATAMASSVLRSDELTPTRKLQHIIWAAGVAVLPDPAANSFIQLAFDHAPQSRLFGILRRA